MFKPTHKAVVNKLSRINPDVVHIGVNLEHVGNTSYLTEAGGLISLENHEVVKLSVKTNMLLPTDAQERKQIPITTGVLDYFPLAIAEVAKCSWAGNQQHHPDKELHWDKTKSTDHADCIARHLVDRGKFDTDRQRHSAKLAWRALALLQLELESEKEG